MPPLVTEAIVLHTFHYLETSLILRLMTRDVGLQSVLARGARNSTRRFGSSLDLFAQGEAEIHVKPNRDLQALTAFDVGRARPSLATDVGRFTAASMIAELALRCSSDEPSPGLFDAVEQAFDRVAIAATDETLEAAIAGAWLIISSLGFSPSLDRCANCDAALDVSAKFAFSHSAGGAICDRCSSRAPGSRTLPSSARDAIRSWAGGGRVPLLSVPDARAHQRLLREFFQQHVGGDSDLRAYKVWEDGAWSAA